MIAARTRRTILPGTVVLVDDEHVEIENDGVVWRFERAFLTSNWQCIFGEGCQGILPERADELQQGCCSYGAHLGDGADGRAEALNVAAFASVLTPAEWQFHDEFEIAGPESIFSDARRNHTRIVDGACIFLNRADFPAGPGCALHVGALAADESPVDWKPSVCWQLPIRVDWEELDEQTEQATVRRWTRNDWGEFGSSMAWCCTEPSEGAEAYQGDQRVVDSMADELSAIAGTAVAVELRRRLR
jgi:hypothetical protein